MNKVLLFIVLFLLPVRGYAQQGYDDKSREKDAHFEKTSDISDRAGGAHNASNIALFFENRGKLYPRRITQGPSGEFPVNSGKHYIYRINPMMGVPGNVIQGRYTTNEEWEAVGGYHNKSLSKIAFSDNPKTWDPVLGWPVKDKNGLAIIKSDQDSYCVYSDSSNSRETLGIVVAQTGYSYGVGFAKNLLFFKYEVINKGTRNLDSFYFSLYADLDIGNISGGVPEYGDDKIGFIKEKNFIYFYDDGVSAEWPGGKTGQMGIAFLKTPVINGIEAGITDMHYNLYDDDSDIDSVQYGIMSSSPYLYNSGYKSRFFHLGTNTSLHYDDVSAIPAGGLDLVANIASGPYNLNIGDTLVFYTAIVAGDTNAELMYYLDQAYRIYNFDFELSKPPLSPVLTAIPGDRRVTLYWDDKAESSKDNFSGEYDFEGYRIYRSLDKGVNWEMLAEYDLPDNIGFDVGIQYSYTDTTIINGFEYWYSVTAYDRGDSSIASLESPRGNSTDLTNIAAVTGSSTASGRTPVSADQAVQSGNGNSNYQVSIRTADNELLSGNEYRIGFTYTSRQQKGKPIIKVKVNINDSSAIGINRYGIEFISKNKMHIIDYSTGDYLQPDPKSYQNNTSYTIVRGAPGQPAALSFQLFGPDANAPEDSLPLPGDFISIAYSVYVIRNNTDTVIHPRPFGINQSQATSDGIIFRIIPPRVIQNLSRVGGTDNFNLVGSVSDSTLLKDELYVISVDRINPDNTIALLVRDLGQDTVHYFESVQNSGSIEFNGLSFRVEFTPSQPPSPGNIYSVNSVVPEPLAMDDSFTFKIQGSSVDRQQMASAMSDIKVVPNPYVVSSLFEPEFGELRREPLRQMQFINLPTECTIYIFTIDADLIKTIEHNSLTGTESWDLRTEGGREIAPGIYIYLVKTGSEEYLSRFAVIK